MTRQWEPNGRPSPLADLGTAVLTPVAAGTSLTNIFTVPITDTGLYLIEARVYSVNVGITGLTVTPGFTGTTSSIGYNVERHTGSATALARHTTFAVSASSIWIRAEISGYFIVTVPGSFTIGVTRAGGTSATVQPGSFLRVYAA